MSLDHTTALQAYHQVGQTRLTDLRTALLKAAVRYAAIRSEWHLLTATERATAYPGRTMAHNRFIDPCNILSREQAKIGDDNKWQEAKGMDRKMVGDFACWVSCWVGIENR